MSSLRNYLTGHPPPKRAYLTFWGGKTIITGHINAGVLELADETDSKSVAREGVWVRPPPPALKIPRAMLWGFFCFSKGLPHVVQTHQVSLPVFQLHIAHDSAVVDRIGRAADDAHDGRPLEKFQKQHIQRKD